VNNKTEELVPYIDVFNKLKAKVIKIDVEKNEELAEALRVKTLPTLIIYKGGEMKWRQSGEQDANTLISIIQQYI
jgi:thioredoxin 1